MIKVFGLATWSMSSIKSDVTQTTRPATICPLAARHGTTRPNCALDCSHQFLESVT